MFIENFCNFIWVSYSFFHFHWEWSLYCLWFFVSKEWFNSSPEIVVRLFAFLWEIIFDGLFSNGHNSVPFPSILFPVALSEFLEFVPGHVSGIEGFAKPGIHIWHRLIFYKLWFHRGMEINNICYQSVCVPCHVVDFHIPVAHLAEQIFLAILQLQSQKIWYISRWRNTSDLLSREQYLQ